jgi:hypothetical protein
MHYPVKVGYVGSSPIQVAKIYYEDIMKDLLVEFFATPGTMSKNDLLKVGQFLHNLNNQLKVYVSATNRFPLGYTLDVEIKKMDWYLDRLNNP